MCTHTPDTLHTYLATTVVRLAKVAAERNDWARKHDLRAEAQQPPELTTAAEGHCACGVLAPTAQGAGWWVQAPHD